MTRSRRMKNACQLMCGRVGTVTVRGRPACDVCVDRIRAIARAAGVAVDEELLTGSIRRLRRGRLNAAERKLADAQERREIERARRSA